MRSPAARRAWASSGLGWSGWAASSCPWSDATAGGRSPLSTIVGFWSQAPATKHPPFSWRLAAAPPEILEYVVVHELCHLREPSHQKPFWRLLETAQPGWQEQASWPRQHGQELLDYDPGRVLPT